MLLIFTLMLLIWWDAYHWGTSQSVRQVGYLVLKIRNPATDSCNNKIYISAKRCFLVNRNLVFTTVGIKLSDRMTGRTQNKRVHYQCHKLHLYNLHTRHHLPFNICQEPETLMKKPKGISACQLRLHLSWESRWLRLLSPAWKLSHKLMCLNM